MKNNQETEIKDLKVQIIKLAMVLAEALKTIVKLKLELSKHER